MAESAATDARMLILLNPGRQSRHYLLGLAAGAGRAGIACKALELGPIWQAASGRDGVRALEQARVQIAELVRKYRITHAIGYVFNGTRDLGLIGGDTDSTSSVSPDTAARGASEPPRGARFNQNPYDGPGQTLWDELGVRHTLLWTDHPEWAMQGCALDDPLRGLLGGPNRGHVLKSESAALEAAAVLGWPNVRAVAMAEDYGAMQPAMGVEAVHDAVAIVGDAAAPAAPTLPFLKQSDPDPAVIDAEMRPHAERAWLKVVGPDHGALVRDWLDLKLVSPEETLWRLSKRLEPAHGDSLAWLRAQPRRWYGAVQTMRRTVGWRRNFWLAWLGRRVDLGIYGSPAAALGVPQTAEGASWVEYQQQSAIYARGRVAVNINAAHDEEGLTHKPFQIAGAGVACVHHAVAGLDACFRPGSEVLTFRRGPELLETVRALGADAPRRAAVASAMRARALAEHTWEHRLPEMLAAVPAGKADVRVPDCAGA